MGRHRKKHTRSRTGCLTCRKRRVKCDENKPLCARCEKGSRQCIYPPTSPIHQEASRELGGNVPDPFFYGPEPQSFRSNDISDEHTMVAFSSALAPASSSHNGHFLEWNLDRQTMSDPAVSNSDPMESQFNPRTMTSSTVPGAGPADVIRGIQQQTTKSHVMSMTGRSIPQLTPPRPKQSRSVQFFLKYHRDTVTEAHYLRFYDYRKFFTKIIFSIVEESEALQDAIVAFSSLIYSLKVEPRVKEFAFTYYAKALQGLRSLLNETTLDMKLCFTAVATALQLSTFDRLFGDAAKSFRHLEGASRIIQRVTDPAQFCSTVVGRCLLEWYIQIEDYCCMLGAYRFLLPLSWRDENVRIRNQIARHDYPRLSGQKRKARILDDVWPQFFAFMPKISDVVHKVPGLKSLVGKYKTETALELDRNIQSFQQTIGDYLKLPNVQEVLQPAQLPNPYISKHASCCPPFPFVPYVMQFPPAGIFRMVTMTINCYIYAVIYPSIQKASTVVDERIQSEGKDLSYYSIEVCRIFAGLEDTLGKGPDSLIPLFTQLVLVTPFCPSELRLWLWYKLVHFENLGMITVDPIKRSLSRLWDMPDITGVCFRNTTLTSSPRITSEDLEKSIREVKLEELVIDETDASSEDKDLEPITQGQGLSGLLT